MPSLPPLVVKFPRQMKLHRIYPVVVAWKGDGFRGGVRQVTLRLMMAGAHVLPNEQTLDAKAGSKATFYVTPLGLGWLREQRLEVLVQGRKVQELPLASKVVCRGRTKFYFLMMFLAPWLLGWMFSAGPDLISDLGDNHIPGIPAAVNKQTPIVSEYWEKGWTWAGENYAKVWNKMWAESETGYLWAFPAFVLFFVLFLLSLWWRRDTRSRRVGPPVPIPSDD